VSALRRSTKSTQCAERGQTIGLRKPRAVTRRVSAKVSSEAGTKRRAVPTDKAGRFGVVGSAGTALRLFRPNLLLVLASGVDEIRNELTV
jgi:hypothetical protein